MRVKGDDRFAWAQFRSLVEASSAACSALLAGVALAACGGGEPRRAGRDRVRLGSACDGRVAATAGWRIDPRARLATA